MRIALNVESRDLGRAHAEKSEAPFVTAIDQLFRWRFGFGQDAEPTERVGPREDGQRAVRNGLAADAVRAVAARDEIAGDLLRLPRAAEANLRRLAIEIVNAYLFDLEEDFRARIETRVDQIFDDFGLAIYRNGAPASQLAQVDSVATPAKTQLDAAMNESLPSHPLADARFVEDVHSALFQNACADTAFDVLAAAVFEHDRFNALQPQQPPKQQSRRACSDNSDLCSHGCSSEDSGQSVVGSERTQFYFPTTHCPLFTAHYPLPTTHYPPPAAHFHFASCASFCIQA